MGLHALTAGFRSLTAAQSCVTVQFTQPDAGSAICGILVLRQVVRVRSWMRTSVPLGSTEMAVRSSAIGGGRLVEFVRDGCATGLSLLSLRMQGASFGRKVRARGRAVSAGGVGEMVLGDRITFRGVESRIHLVVSNGGHLRIGSGCFFNAGVMVHATKLIEFGEGCLIGDGCRIADSNFHNVHEGSQTRSSAIRLGDNVWLGAGAIVLPGVSIGSHSIVAAGSVVFEDMPAKQIWRGNPAVYHRDVRASDGFRRL